MLRTIGVDVTKCLVEDVRQNVNLMGVSYYHYYCVGGHLDKKKELPILPSRELRLGCKLCRLL